MEIWKLSRADTVKPDAPPLTRKEEPERSFGSDRCLVEGRVRYAAASSSFLLSPCKAEQWLTPGSAAPREPHGTGLARGLGFDPTSSPHGGFCCAEWGRARRLAEPRTGNSGSHLMPSLWLGNLRLAGVAGMREPVQGNRCLRCRARRRHCNRLT